MADLIERLRYKARPRRPQPRELQHTMQCTMPDGSIQRCSVYGRSGSYELRRIVNGNSQSLNLYIGVKTTDQLATAAAKWFQIPVTSVKKI